MKTLFMFPGQGAQQVGMGKDLAGALPEIAELYRQANDIVGYDLASLCFDGPQERLNQTDVSQPAIFVTSCACLRALEAGRVAADLAQIQPDAGAGLSLGEYTALHAAGALSFEEGLRLVQLRGRCMQAAAEMQQGSMVSVMGLEADAAVELCAAVLNELNNPTSNAQLLVPVNFNCPGQIVLSGTVAACSRAVELAEQYGATRALPLQVAGAFHTQLMAPAAEKLKEALDNCEFLSPKYPVFANVDAQPYESAEQIPNKLLEQLVNPVLWQQTVEKLLDDGFQRFVEIGPGRVLTGLVKKTARARKATPQMINISALSS